MTDDILRVDCTVHFIFLHMSRSYVESDVLCCLKTQEGINLNGQKAYKFERTPGALTSERGSDSTVRILELLLEIERAKGHPNQRLCEEKPLISKIPPLLGDSAQVLATDINLEALITIIQDTIRSKATQIIPCMRHGMLVDKTTRSVINPASPGFDMTSINFLTLADFEYRSDVSFQIVTANPNERRAKLFVIRPDLLQLTNTQFKEFRLNHLAQPLLCPCCFSNMM